MLVEKCKTCNGAKTINKTRCPGCDGKGWNYVFYERVKGVWRRIWRRVHFARMVGCIRTAQPATAQATTGDAQCAGAMGSSGIPALTVRE